MHIRCRKVPHIRHLNMYQWFVVVGSFFAFIYGFGTGANDLGNSVSTSVGSKTLKMWQAIVIAIAFEFTGALVLGRVSTNTLQGGVADINQFKNDPDLYAYGMMIALGVSGFLQILGSYLEMNISATHSIIGSIIGFSLIYKGKDGVLWAKPDHNSFPPYKGVAPIFFSWLISPVLTAIASSTVFGLCKYLVLRRKNPMHKSAIVLPFAVFLTMWVNIYFVFTKGAKKMLSEKDNWSDHKAAIIALYVAVATSAASAIIGVPAILYYTKKRFLPPSVDEDNTIRTHEIIELENIPQHSTTSQEEQQTKTTEVTLTNRQLWLNKIKDYFADKIDIDVDNVEDDELVAKIHKKAEVFDIRAEYVFSFLQVFSAICVMLSHGAGEVGYMAGPLAAIWEFYKHGTVAKKLVPPVWIILIGAFGLVFGLSLYGQKVTRAMAIKLSKLSPTRGFAAELATAMVIMVASQYGLPTSSSQCITGGIIGVGLMEGVNGVNWRFFVAQVSSWIINLFLSIGLTALIVAQAVYTPSIYQSSELHTYQHQLNYVTKDLVMVCNTSGVNLVNVSKGLDAISKIPNPNPSNLVSLLNTTLTYYKNNTC